MLITLTRRTAICQSVCGSLVDQCDSVGSYKSQIYFLFILLLESPCECGIEPPGSISYGVRVMLTTTENHKNVYFNQIGYYTIK